MAEIAETQDNNPALNILDYYKSVSIEHRLDDQMFINLAIERNIIPTTIRYGILNKNIYRGVIQDQSGSLHYFSYVPSFEFKIVKADTTEKLWDSNRMLKACTLGCDLVKSEEEKEDKEKEEKAIGGETSGMAAVSPIPERESVVAQNRLLTEVHPGAAGGSTPDTHEQKWHPDAMQMSNDQEKALNPWDYQTLLKALGNQLQANAPVPSRMPTDKEKQYMIEIMGKTPNEVNQGDVQLNAMNRASYNRWLSKSAFSKLDNLKKILNK